MNAGCPHEWERLRWSEPYQDLYGHVYFPEITRCVLCGREKTSWRAKIIGWTLAAIIGFSLLSICMGWGN